MLDLWLPLAMGQRIVIAPSAVMKDFTSVRDLISQHQVVGVTGVPSLLQVSQFTVCSTTCRMTRHWPSPQCRISARHSRPLLMLMDS